MYILSILGVVLSVLLMGCSGGGGLTNIPVSLAHITDVISVLLVFIITIPILASSGLHKDFNNAFKLTLGKKEAGSLLELKRAKEAVMLVTRTVILSGILFWAFSTIMILYDVIGDTDTIEKLSSMFHTFFANEAICILSIFYAMVVSLMLLPIMSRLEVKMAEFMQE